MSWATIRYRDFYDVPRIFLTEDAKTRSATKTDRAQFRFVSSSFRGDRKTGANERLGYQ